MVAAVHALLLVVVPALVAVGILVTHPLGWWDWVVNHADGVLATANGWFFAALAGVVLLRRRNQSMARLPPLAQTALLAASLSLLATLSTLESWGSTDEAYSTITLLPFSDAADYLVGADSLLRRDELTEFNQRRPLNVMLLAVRLALARGDLQMAILLQVALFSTLLGFATLILRRNLGWMPALWFALVCCGVASRWLPLFLSEGLGISIGVLGAALLLQTLFDRRPRWLVAACFSLALAQSARIGPLFVFPALVVWAAVVFGPGLKARMLAVGSSALAIVAGLSVTNLLRWVHLGNWGGGNGNFSWTLYGLVTGDADWKRVFVEHPHLYALPIDERNAAIYALCREAFFDDPLVLLGTLIEVLPYSVEATFTVLAMAASPLDSDWRPGGLVLAAVGLLGLRTAWRDRQGLGTLMLCCFGGFIASLPVIIPDGGVRLGAAFYPALVALLAMGLAKVVPRREDPLPTVAPIAALIAPSLALLALVGPAMARHTVPDALKAPPPPAPSGVERFAVGPWTPHLLLGVPGPTRAPRVSLADTHKVVDRTQLGEALRDVPLPATLALATSGRPGREAVWLIGPPDLVRETTRIITVEGTPKTVADWYRVMLVPQSSAHEESPWPNAAH